MAAIDKKTTDAIFKRAHYLANQMIFSANYERKKDKGDPKVGGHSSGSSSALHIMGALHLFVKSGFDHIANKPHASPADHAFNYLLDNLLKDDLSKLSQEEADVAMSGLRAFSRNGEPVFQSYHSAFDPDKHNFFPSGTVGIPPVQAGYLALAYTYAKNHGYKVPENAHFWSLIGDSEFREGSLFEAVPDFAERQIGNLTWIVDYNRQSLDGHRLVNKSILGGTDAERIEGTMAANGWEVVQLRHGSLRKKLFKAKDGESFKNLLEKELDDYTLQSLLLVEDPKELCKNLIKDFKGLKSFIDGQKPEDVWAALRDFAGHDIETLIEALEKSKKSTDRPTIIIAHTLKGWGLEMAAQSNNHSSLPSKEEILTLRKNTGLKEDQPYGRFEVSSAEGKFLKERGEKIYKEIKEQHKIKKENSDKFKKDIGSLPDTLGINLKMASYPHTQWMLGQLTSKLTRIANTDKSKLNETEKLWKTASELMVSMAPDVGTSTNLNPSMDGKIFEAGFVEDKEAEYGVKNDKNPDLIPGEDKSDRFLRFEIAEANVMSCLGSFGQMRDTLGIPIMPLMTVYDFFIKRAHDQFFYNLYWRSSFILAGTPSGVTLSPEGAQHGWKSDFEIPNQITWEPFFCQELDWIFCHSLKKHFEFDNTDKNGVVVRGVTRGAQQKDFLKYLKMQKRFKDQSFTGTLNFKGSKISGGTDQTEVSNIDEATIMETTRQDVLRGAYKLIDYDGYEGYEPGDNVVNIFAMGSLGTEAIEASNKLLEKGIFANVIMVTSTDLLLGNIAYKDNYDYLKSGLNINSNLYLKPMANGSWKGGEVQTFSGRRIPIVSVHDGEPGLLDNIGSIIGVKHVALAVRKHSKCGTPVDIYKYHGINADGVIEAAGKVLAETALEQVTLSNTAVAQVQAAPVQTPPPVKNNWRELWNN